MAAEIIFGHLKDVSIGDTFVSYIAMNEVGVHRSSMGGISGRAKDGADSVVISGGYENDFDQGDVIVYTGQGGRNEKVTVILASPKTLNCDPVVHNISSH